MRKPLSWLLAASASMARENREWMRTPGEIVVCMLLPIFWMLIVWGLLGDGVMTRVGVAFVDEDKSPLSRETGRAIAANRSFGLMDYPDAGAALAALRAGDVYGAVVIPFGYARDMLSGRGSSVILYLDENRYAVAGTLQAEMTSIMSAVSGGELYLAALQAGDGSAGAARMLGVVHSDFYALGNMQFSFLAFLGGAVLPGVIMVCAMLGFMTAIARELWNGSVAAWLASAGGSVSAAVFGKLAPHFAYYCLLFLFYIALFAGQGGFAPAGPLFLWFVFGALCLAVFCAMTILIYAVAPNWRFALVVASGYAAPALPFTGFSIPLDSMGEYARAFSQCLPITWLLQGQAQVWTLGARLPETGNTLFAFFLLFLLPLVLGYPFFRKKMLRKAAKGQEPA